MRWAGWGKVYLGVDRVAVEHLKQQGVGPREHEIELHAAEGEGRGGVVNHRGGFHRDGAVSSFDVGVGAPAEQPHAALVVMRGGEGKGTRGGQRSDCKT